MADMYGLAQQRNVGRAADGTSVKLRMLRDGSQIVAPWYEALVMEGVCFQAEAHGGNIFTGITLLAFASYADTAKAIFVDIPDGKLGIPLEVLFNFLATGAAIVHYASFVSPTLNGTGGTETAITPVNLSLLNNISTGATAAHTADSEVDVVTGAEIFLSRLSTSQDLDGVGISPVIVWRAADGCIAPMIVDGGSINVNANPTTSGTGMGHIVYAELDESVL